MASSKHVGKHRLGTPGLVHCVSHRAVSAALEEHHRTWFSAMLVPAQHSLAGFRRRALQAALERVWVPATT